MFKAISLVRSLEGKSREEFAAFWLERFAPVAARLPGLLGYTINVTTADSPSREWDGFTEIWFASRADYDVAFAVSDPNAELEKLRPQFISTYAMHFVDETRVIEESPG